jgi:formylglycine-generating enzyme required for sulfatase activity
MPATKQEPRFEVFISYRRGAADELALLLQTHLERRNVEAFLDRDLGRGVFDEMVLRRIAESPTFLIILTPNALDRCADEEDWVRKEIVQAISTKRNIVPLLVDSFQFTPEIVRKLDPAIRELSRYQAVEYSRPYFPSVMDRIVRMLEEDRAERTAVQEAKAAEVKPSTHEAEAIIRQPHYLHRLLWVGGLVVVLAVLIIGGMWLFRSANGGHQGLATPTPTPAKTAAISQPRSNTSGDSEKAHQSPTVVAGAIKTKENPKDGQQYVWIQPGKFPMGCSEGDNECDADEKPTHPVTITKGFWLEQTPVTQEAYQRVKGTNPSHFRGEKRPVENVSWNQANEYCEAAGGRLPTEAEWEYAARANSREPRYGEPKTIAWYSENSGGQTHDVGLKKANLWGLQDMLGNVWQWTIDWYDEKYYANSPSKDPTGPAAGKYRVLRGGSWIYDSRYLRASDRVRGEPDYRFAYIGFRCIREVIP